jgi:hypothetical protein
MDRILYILALICFAADAFNVPVSVKLFSLGAAFLVASLVF